MLLNFAPVDTSQFVGGGGSRWHVAVLHSLQSSSSDPSHSCNFYTETEHLFVTNNTFKPILKLQNKPTLFTKLNPKIQTEHGR